MVRVKVAVKVQSGRGDILGVIDEIGFVVKESDHLEIASTIISNAGQINLVHNGNNIGGSKAISLIVILEVPVVKEKKAAPGCEAQSFEKKRH